MDLEQTQRMPGRSWLEAARLALFLLGFLVLGWALLKSPTPSRAAMPEARLSPILQNQATPISPEGDQPSALAPTVNITLTGRVLDARNNTPLVAATVVVTDAASHRFVAITGTDGRFTFSPATGANLASGQAVVLAGKIGYFPETRSPFLPDNTPISLGDIPLQPTPNLAIRKTDGMAILSPGQLVTYTVSITNTGIITAQEINIVDSLINLFFQRLITNTLSPGQSLTPIAGPPGSFSWRLNPNLPPNGKATFKLVAQANPGLTPSIVNNLTNQICVETTTPEFDLTNNCWTDTNQTPNADLRVGKKASNPFPSEGDLFDFTVTITNTGPSVATNVVLTDALPTSVLTYTANLPSQGTFDRPSGRWNVGQLAVGAHATLRLSFRVWSNVPGQTATNTVTAATSDLPDPTPTNTASASVTISTRLTGRVTDENTGAPLVGAQVVATNAGNTYTTTTNASGYYTITNTTPPLTPGAVSARASMPLYYSVTKSTTLTAGKSSVLNFALPTIDLKVGKTDFQTAIAPNQFITYTLTLTNASSVTATGVVVSDTLGTYLAFQRIVTSTLPSGLNLRLRTTSTAATRIWDLTRDLKPRETISFKLVARVASSLPTTGITNIINAFAASTTGLEANKGNNRITDVNTYNPNAPNISITIAASTTQARINEQFFYTIRVSNSNANADATNLFVTGTVSQYLTIASNPTTTRGSASRDGRNFSINVGTLAQSHGTVTITVNVRVNNISSNQTATQTATAEYNYSGGSTQTRTSNSVGVSLLASTTLPGTGGIELTGGAPEQILAAPVEASASAPSFFWFIEVCGVVFAMFSLAALALGLILRVRGEKVGNLLMIVGGVVLALSLLSGLFALRPAPRLASLSRPSSGGQPSQATPVPADPGNAYGEQLLTPQVLETLPDYPIPSPTISATPLPGSAPQDTTPPERIVIPAMALDAVVKYVPYDGITWLIAGLQNEIAWMGDTSWPGLPGNTAMAGHVTLRTGADGPFKSLSALAAGETITIYTQENMYMYKVREQQEVLAEDVTVLDQSRRQELTLITCTAWDPGLRLYTKRLIVAADLVKVSKLP